MPSAATDIIEDILWQGHAIAIHGGVSDNVYRLRNFVWPGKQPAIQQLIQRCPTCQIIDAPRARVNAHVDRPLQGFLHPVVPAGSPFACVILDHVPMPSATAVTRRSSP